MHATIYGRGQMVIPAQARKEAGINTGDVVAVQTEGDGRIVLIRLERPELRKSKRVRLMRRKGKHAIIVGGPTVTMEQIKKLIQTEIP